MKRQKIADSKRNMVMARDQFRCVYCLTKAVEIEIGRTTKGHASLEAWTETGVLLVVDHLVPYSKTKDNRFDNLVTACETCNRKKGNTSTNFRPFVTPLSAFL